MTNILLCGYTGWIDSSFTETAFPDCLVVIAGERGKAFPGPKVRFVPEDSLREREVMSRLLSTYAFSFIFHFSESIAFLREDSAEEITFLSTLAEVLPETPETKLIAFSGGNPAGADRRVQAEVLDDARLNLLRACIRRSIPCLFAKSPWVYSVSVQEKYLGAFLEAGMAEKRFAYPYAPDQEIRMVSSDDLAVLCYRITDRFSFREEVRFLSFGTSVRAEDLGEAFAAAAAGRMGGTKGSVSCSYEEGQVPVSLQPVDAEVRERYGWFQEHSVLDDAASLLPEKTKRRKRLPEKKKRAAGMEAPTPVLPVKIAAELLAGFVLMEALNRLSGVQAQFRMVDFRLLYVAVAGLMYNIPAGLAAAALASVSLIAGYARTGVGWMTLFYEPTNWFAFIAYFTMGAVCGYIRVKDRENLAFARSELEAVREKYRFLRELFLQSQEEKQSYRRQIINSRDSFGKIFRITQELDVVLPHLVFIHALSVIEEIMENRTAAIYSVGSNKGFARLEVASRGLDADRSIRMEDYQAVTEKILSDGIFVNTGLDERYPMYASGVVRDGEIVLIVMLMRAEFGQMSLYYSNLLKILCGLISTSLLRSISYQELTKSGRCHEGTNLLRAKAFAQELEVAAAMKLQKIANYSLHRLEIEGTPQEANAMLSGKIRENDMAAYTASGVYLLISQSTPEGVQILKERLQKNGISMADAYADEVLQSLKEETEKAEGAAPEETV